MGCIMPNFTEEPALRIYIFEYIYVYIYIYIYTYIYIYIYIYIYFTLGQLYLTDYHFLHSCIFLLERSNSCFPPNLYLSDHPLPDRVTIPPEVGRE